MAGRVEGFRLQEIAELLATGGEPSWKDLARAKLAEIRAQMTTLRAIEQGLIHAVGCPSDNVLRCEHFRAELDAVLPVGDQNRAPRRSPSLPAWKRSSQTGR